MKPQLDVGLKIGYALNGLLLALTGNGRILRMVRASRPNWSARACLRATNYLLGKGLRPRGAFGTLGEYLSYLDRQLADFADRYPVSAKHEVADPLSLERWESRWRRARSRSTIARDKTEAPLLSAQEKEAA